MQVVPKSSGQEPDGYQKQINLDLLRLKEIAVLEKLINKLGYKNISDYKINYYNHTAELIVINRDLHRDLKIIRRTKYTKTERVWGGLLWSF
jgi:hypothetical protein